MATAASLERERRRRFGICISRREACACGGWHYCSGRLLNTSGRLGQHMNPTNDSQSATKMKKKTKCGGADVRPGPYGPDPGSKASSPAIRKASAARYVIRNNNNNRISVLPAAPKRLAATLFVLASVAIFGPLIYSVAARSSATTATAADPTKFLYRRNVSIVHITREISVPFIHSNML